MNEMKQQPQLSIIIVHYRTYELTKQTIESILMESYGFEFEILLVDNASGDGSIEKLAEDFLEEQRKGRLLILCNQENLGFSKANNIAIRKAKGSEILLLNSDTKIVQNAIKQSLDAMKQRPQVGALGVRILLADGSLDHACKRGFPTPAASLCYFLKLHRLFPHSPFFAAYIAGHIPQDQTAQVDSLSGAYMLLRREALMEAGLLCEDYFMYGEDIDLCFQIKKSGWQILYFSEAQIIHYKGGSGRKNPKVIREFYRAMKVFYDRNYASHYPKIIRYLMVLAVDFACKRALKKARRT